MVFALNIFIEPKFKYSLRSKSQIFFLSNFCIKKEMLEDLTECDDSAGVVGDNGGADGRHGPLPGDDEVVGGGAQVIRTH